MASLGHVFITAVSAVLVALLQRGRAEQKKQFNDLNEVNEERRKAILDAVILDAEKRADLLSAKNEERTQEIILRQDEQFGRLERALIDVRTETHRLWSAVDNLSAWRGRRSPRDDG